jgi:DNA-binding beta-propeller fold protein YncE
MFTVEAQDASAPQLRRIKPETITAGAPTFTLRLEGRFLNQDAKIFLDGAELAGPRVSENGRVALVELDESVAAAPGTHTVRAVNPDGKETATTTLTVVERDPELIAELRGNALEEDETRSFASSITGEGFNNRSAALFWGAESSTTNFVSENEIEMLIPIDLLEEPARVPVMVRNRGGGLSNVEIFFVVPRPARIDEINPFEVVIGNEDIPLQVFGDNFKRDSRIVVNGIPLETSRPRTGRLEATVPASLRTEPRQLIVRVEQEGVQSNDFTLGVTPTDLPFVFTVGPNRVRLGETRANLNLSGANFKGEIAVLIDGEEANVREQFRRSLRVGVPRSLLSTAGTRSVQIRDEDGNLSNTVSFEVVPDVEVATLAGSRGDGFNLEQSCVTSNQAMFRRPSRVAFGPDGLLYIADQQNHSIRTVNPATGEVCTVAGATGLSGYNDSVNPRGFAVRFSNPLGVAVASDGTIYVTENGNSVIRRIRRQASGIVVDTFAGGRSLITGTDRQNNLQSTLRGSAGLRDGDGQSARFRQPDDIVIAPDGAIFVSDAGNHTIRRIRESGGQVTVETIAGNGIPGFVDGAGPNARFRSPTGLALSADGSRLFVADTSNHRIRVIDLATLRVTTFTGGGLVGLVDGPPPDASFNQPIGLAIDDDQVLYVAEGAGRRIRRIDAAGNVTSLAGAEKVKFRDGPGLKATFKTLRGLAIDRAAGILFVADYENSRVRRIELD